MSAEREALERILTGIDRARIDDRISPGYAADIRDICRAGLASAATTEPCSVCGRPTGGCCTVVGQPASADRAIAEVSVFAEFAADLATFDGQSFPHCGHTTRKLAVRAGARALKQCLELDARAREAGK